jgi:DNA-binding response OmpR family regulator
MSVMPKILIVDDEKDTRVTLTEYLANRIKCEIVEAADGYAALEKLKSNAVDLILLDITMPGISGTEVIKEAKVIAKDVSIIVLTKWDSTDVAKQTKELGADYIPKPFSLKVVRLKVEEKLKAIGKFESLS